MRLETPLSRVRGLGSAGHGGSDWWSVRLNSIALLLLSVWLITSLLRLPQLDHATVTEWLRDPLAAVPMLLFVVATFWHIKHGLREVIDDYAHTESGRVLWITLLSFFVYGGGAFALFCVLKIAFGGSAL
ncbi:MAG TPA: succinate dehydrogenase, hydrophobic membrane anchor protein [Allosphingosinicella sp.]|jgi:succinate dehydrogenase / fumarate reductase membrane anchor subunit